MIFTAVSTAFAYAGWGAASTISFAVISYFVIVLGLVRLVREAKPFAPSVQDVHPIAVGVGVSAVAALAMIAFLGQGGIPVQRHDWTWPVDRTALANILDWTVNDWNSEGYGSPKAYPTLYPFYALLSIAAAFVGTKTALDVVLVAIPGVAAIGLMRLHRSLGGKLTFPAVLGAAAFAYAPFLSEELTSGHIPTMIAYALLPFVAEATLAIVRLQNVRSIAALSLCVALSAMQLQFIAYNAVVCAIVLLAVRPSWRSIVAVAIGYAVGLTAHVQSFMHLFSGTGGIVGNTSVEWLRALSVSGFDSFRFAGYIGQYTDKLYAADGATELRAFIPALLVGVLCAVAANGPRAAIATAIFAVGLVGATGLNEPLAFVKSFLAEHVSAYAAFREAFNFQALMAFGLALAITGLPRSRRVLIGATALVAFLSIPMATGSGTSLLETWAPQGVLTQLPDFARTNDGSRLTLLPLIAPVRTDGRPDGGIDPYFMPIGTHPTSFEWQASRVKRTAQMLMVAGHGREVPVLLGAYGSRDIVFRPQLTSALPHYSFSSLMDPAWETHVWDAAVHASPVLSPIVGDAEAEIDGDAAYRPVLYLGAAGRWCEDASFYRWIIANRCPAARPPSAARNIPLVPSRDRFDPSFGAWASNAATYFLALSVAASADGGLISASPARVTQEVVSRFGHLYARCASVGTMLIEVDDAPAVSCYTGSLEHARLLALPSSGGPRHRVAFVNENGSPSAVFGLIDAANLADAQAAGLSEFAFAYSGGKLTFARTSANRFFGFYQVAKPRTLVLSDSFDPRWRLRLDDGTILSARRVNATMNGFTVSPGNHAFEVVFDPGLVDRIAGMVQVLFWPTALAALYASQILRGWSSLIRSLWPLSKEFQDP